MRKTYFPITFNLHLVKLTGYSSIWHSLTTMAFHLARRVCARELMSTSWLLRSSVMILPMPLFTSSAELTSTCVGVRGKRQIFDEHVLHTVHETHSSNLHWRVCPAASPLAQCLAGDHRCCCYWPPPDLHHQQVQRCRWRGSCRNERDGPRGSRLRKHYCCCHRSHLH